jgi:hypothetical protein
MADVRLKVKKITNNINPRLRRLRNDLKTVAPKAADFFKSETPIRTGNAKRRTKLQGETIKANYEYASRLDNGYSRQAPDGMSKPTIDFIRKLMARIIRRA